MKLWYKN